MTEGQGGLAVRRLQLTNFRCYRALRLETDRRPVVLFGPNGAGKTNLLEAVSLLLPGRGLRRARLSDLGRKAGTAPPQAWGIAASLDTPQGRVDIGTGSDPAGGERRLAKIDGKLIRGQAELGRRVGAVWLTPQMDRLFVESASGRRRFLDRLVYGLDTDHAGRLSAYEHALRERARLLKAGRADPAWLAALEETMAAQGTAVAAARREVVARLGEISARPVGPFPAAGLNLEGMVESWLEEMPALAAEEKLRAALLAARRQDAESGGAACGPHRSDFMALHLAKGIAAPHCSTGEQKALLISIVLAHARLEASRRGAAPLLLLDEVAAHLDAARRRALFEGITELGAQAWMTGTDEGLFEGLEGRAGFYRVENAELSEVSVR